MAILLDFNPTVIAAVNQGHKEFGEDLTVDIIRNVVLNMILSYRKQFGNKYGKLVICCDSGDGWRKEFFPFYKYSRKKTREESPLNWPLIFSSLDAIRNELIEYMPYKVMALPRCEADDIIAVLSRYIVDYEPIEQGIDFDTQDVLILSRDKDFKQLQTTRHIVQWSPVDKKWLREPNAKEFLIEHIIRGDSGDGVPNMLSDDDSFVIKKRQSQIRTTFVEDVIANGVPPKHKAGYDRNKRLIDLTMVPQDLQEGIIAEYKNHTPNAKSKLLNYLIKYKLKNLYDNAQFF